MPVSPDIDRDVTRTGHSPGAVPTTTDETNEIMREFDARIAAIEEVLDLHTASPYIRSRLAAVDRGTFGARGVERALERMEAEASRREAFQTDEDRLNVHFWAACREMGARVDGRGLVDWPPEDGDRRGAKRQQEAVRRARVALDAEKRGIR
jgi:hypothetical protein